MRVKPFDSAHEHRDIGYQKSGGEESFDLAKREGPIQEGIDPNRPSLEDRWRRSGSHQGFGLREIRGEDKSKFAKENSQNN
jgi:hypothetical protein